MEQEVNIEPFARAERLPLSLPWAVYRAIDARSGHVVRLSVLWLAEHVSEERVRAGLDWFAEAGYQAQRLTSPALPSVLSYRSEGDAAWVATDFPAGQTLKERLAAEGPLPVERVMQISSVVASVLAQAHAVGWAHGWLSAETVCVSEGDVVTVTDLGLGIAAQPLLPGAPAPHPAQSGFFVADPRRRDLQCLGLLVTQMLTGHLPDPVGVPRADVFPPEVPPNVVKQVRALINPQVDTALSAAEWAEFARVGEMPASAAASTEVDTSYYEPPITGRYGTELRPSMPWSRFLWGGAAIVLILVLAGIAQFLMNRPAPPPAAAPAPPASTTKAPSATSDQWTAVQVGPVALADEDKMVARLRQMGFEPYVRPEGNMIYLQVGAFANPESVQNLQNRLTAAGLPVRLQQVSPTH